MIQKSARLPILIALPVLLILGAVAVVLLLPDPPTPPPAPDPRPLDNTTEIPPADGGDDPLEYKPDPRPQPRPDHGAPDSAAKAEAMLEEAWGAMEEIRSRLELKYKYADYTLDRTLTLETVMRKLSRLDGAYFVGNDYALAFPEAEGDLVRIECATISGRDLPDGPLSMSVDMRTGETKRDGKLFARDANGHVLLSDTDCRTLTELLREPVLTHFAHQRALTGELAPVTNLLPEAPPSPFSADDFKAIAVGAMGYRLSCHSVGGQTLATPIDITGDYATNSISVTSLPSRQWMPPPDDRESFKRRIQGLLDDVSRMAITQLENGTKVEDLRVYLLGGSWWYYRYADFSPFDIKLEVTDLEARKITITVAGSYGSPLPFKAVRFISDGSGDGNHYAD